jgi:hypothetical protein
MKPIVFYRSSEISEEELAAIRDNFQAVESRMQIPEGSLVIGRYSCLPFYRELATDLSYIGATLINSIREHEYIADLGSYILDLENMTFKTWYSLDQVPKSEAPFILKGATNSLKNCWSSKMYASTWEDAVQVHIALQQDSLIGTQHIYVRKYEKLFQLGTTLTGLPITKEFRFFIYKGEVLTGGFYWDAYADDLPEVPSVDEVPTSWLKEAISRVSDYATFFVMDVAQTEHGQWKVVELNDGQMSGLSGNSAVTLYTNLRQALS